MFRVMPGLDPGIHVFCRFADTAWMAGTSPAMTSRMRKHTMATHKLLLLPGDGIGPEVMAEVKRLIAWINAQGLAHFTTEEGLVGGAAYDASQQSITDATMAQATAADAVIFGAVGGPKI